MATQQMSVGARKFARRKMDEMSTPLIDSLFVEIVGDRQFADLYATSGEIVAAYE